MATRWDTSWERWLRSRGKGRGPYQVQSLQESHTEYYGPLIRRNPQLRLDIILGKEKTGCSHEQFQRLIGGVEEVWADVVKTDLTSNSEVGRGVFSRCRRSR